MVAIEASSLTSHRQDETDTGRCICAGAINEIECQGGREDCGQCVNPHTNPPEQSGFSYKKKQSHREKLPVEIIKGPRRANIPIYAEDHVLLEVVLCGIGPNGS